MRRATRGEEITMITGRCLCSTVRYEIDGKLGPVVYCYCSQCRRASGTAFAANANVRLKYFRWVAGRDAIREYESSPGKIRAFCTGCGSPVYSRTTIEPDTIRIRLGLLNEDPERRSLAHCWVSSKAPWVAITDDLPQFEEGPTPNAAAR